MKPKAADDRPTGRDLQALLEQEPDPADLAPVEGEGDIELPEGTEGEPAEPGQEPASPDGSDPEGDPDAGGAEGELADELGQAGGDEPAGEGEPAPTGTPSKTSPFKPEPITLRVDGRHIELPGAVQGDWNGQRVRIIPEDTWQRHVARLLHDPHKRQEQDRRHREQLADLAPDNHPLVIAAKLYNKSLLDPIMALVEGGDPEKMQAFFQDLPNRIRELRVEVREAVAESKEKRTTARNEADAEERQVAVYREQIQHGLRNGIEAILQEEDYRDLGLSAQQLYDQFYDIRSTLFFEASAEDARRYGVAEGSLMVSLDAMRAQLRPAVIAKAKFRRPGGKPRQEQVNRAAAGKAPGKKPPAQPGRGATTPPGGGGKPGSAAAPANREEWEAGLAKLAGRGRR